MVLLVELLNEPRTFAVHKHNRHLAHQLVYELLLFSDSPGCRQCMGFPVVKGQNPCEKIIIIICSNLKAMDKFLDSAQSEVREQVDNVGEAYRLHTFLLSADIIRMNMVYNRLWHDSQIDIE